MIYQVSASSVLKVGTVCAATSGASIAAIASTQSDVSRRFIIVGLKLVVSEGLRRYLIIKSLKLGEREVLKRFFNLPDQFVAAIVVAGAVALVEFHRARNGSRTRTAITGQGILSPSCLPIPPSGQAFVRTKVSKK